MMTPQEVASHPFARANFGGYNMAMVDEFLDALTEDYTALYNDNAILKSKLKVLSETVEEYRATDGAMRKALLAAQKMADQMISEAEQKKAELLGNAEKEAAEQLARLQADVAAEEYRLRQAQEATAAYVAKLAALHDQEVDFLSRLNELVPPDITPQDDPSAEIQASVSALYSEEEGAAPAPAAPAGAPEEDPAADDGQPALDADATRRFKDLQFGKDYKIQ